MSKLNKRKQIEKVVMNEKKRVYNIKATEEKNELHIKKLAVKSEIKKKVEERKDKLENDKKARDQNVSSVQALTKHYQNQIEFLRNQLDEIKLENYIADTAQKDQLSKMKQEMKGTIKKCGVY